MTILLVGVVLLVLLFGGVLAFGAPYLPTLRPQTTAALDLLDLRPGQTLLELGSGGGTVMKAAAQRGLYVVGYELNPILVVVSYLRTFRHRRQVRIIWGNFWTATWPPSDGIYTFLLDKYMQKLDKKIMQTYQGKSCRLASLAFKIPGKKAARSRRGVHLYVYSSHSK